MRLKAMLTLSLVVAAGVARAEQLGQSEVEAKLTQAKKLAADGELEEMDKILATLREAVPNIDAIRAEGYVKGITANMELAKTTLVGFFSFQPLTAVYFVGKDLLRLSDPTWPMAEADRNQLNKYFAKETQGIVATMFKHREKLVPEDRSILVDIRSLAEKLGIRLDVPPELKVLAHPQASFDDEKLMNSAMHHADFGNLKEMEATLAQLESKTTWDEREPVRALGYSKHIKNLLNEAWYSMKAGHFGKARSSYEHAVELFNENQQKAGQSGKETMAESMENGHSKLLTLLEENIGKSPQKSPKKSQKMVFTLLQGIRKTGVKTMIPSSLITNMRPIDSSATTVKLTREKIKGNLNRNSRSKQKGG